MRERGRRAQQVSPDPQKPLQKAPCADAVDSVGSIALTNVLATTRHGGAVAACGWAGGMDLPISVAPFILCGASLFGIESVMSSIADGERHGASGLDREKLAAITSGIGPALEVSWKGAFAVVSWLRSGNHVQSLLTNIRQSRA